MAERRRLSRLLLLSHVGLAVLLATLILVTGARVIGAAAQEQAVARVAQASAEGLRQMVSAKRELGVVAGLLSERPTLQRFLRRGQASEAIEFLEPFRATAGVDFVRINLGADLFAQVGHPPPDLNKSGLQFDEGGTPWQVEQRLMDAARPQSGLIIVAARHPAITFAGEDGQEIQLRLLGPDSVDAEFLAPVRMAALREVFATGEAADLGRGEGYASIRLEPLRDAQGTAVGVLETSIPRDVVARQTMGWMMAFIGGSALIVLIAAAVAVALARRISRPFSVLAESASRLGSGDLETPVPQFASDLDEPARLAGSLENMRKQVNALNVLERRQRLELDAVLDGVDEGIVALDLDRRVRYANRQFMELVGRGENQVLGVFCGDILQPAPVNGELPCKSRCPLLRARLSGMEQRDESCLAGGRMRSLVLRVAAPVGGQQVAIVREETPAEAARTVRDAILANLSHEFQTPLAAQVASIELLRDHLKATGDAVGMRLADSQYRGALRLTHLVDNLLASVRMEAGEFRIRRQPLRLDSVVREAVDLMRPLIEQRGQCLQLALAQHTASIVGDPQRLQQVVVNLLANANKFAPDNSTIWLELEVSADQATLWVEDEGDGLPSQLQHHDLFAPFRRAPEAEPSQRGTGLGLAIVHSLVQRHGGEVEVTAPVHRSGARIGIHLPLEVACES